MSISQHSVFRSTKVFSSLDGLRCLSILGVLWHHTVEPPTYAPILFRGFLGVDMFFVLSGFLIVTLLLREKETHSAISLKSFYVRRALRIFPLYYGLLLALAVTLFFVFPQPRMAEPFLQAMPFYTTYTSNWIHDTTFMAITWSLATEEQFYLFWPLVERFLRGGCVYAILAGLIFVNQLVNFAVVDGFLQEVMGLAHLEILDSTFTPICLGVALAHVLHSRRGFAFVVRFLGRRHSSLVTLLALVCALNIPVHDISGLPRLAIQILMTMLLCCCVLREEHMLSKPLSWRPVRRLGTLSYGMYLFHMMARQVAVFLLGSLPLRLDGSLFIVCTLLTIVLAEVSFRYYETPFLRLKVFFSRI